MAQVTGRRERQQPRKGRAAQQPRHGHRRLRALEAQQLDIAALRGQVAQLQTALDSRVVIEQAKGVLAARLDCSVEEAFELLRRTARSHRAPIHGVAAEIVAARNVTEMVNRVIRRDGFSSSGVPPRRQSPPRTDDPGALSSSLASARADAPRRCAPRVPRRPRHHVQQDPSARRSTRASSSTDASTTISGIQTRRPGGRSVRSRSRSGSRRSLRPIRSARSRSATCCGSTHAAPAAHTVIDKYEHAPGVVNADALTFSGGPYDLIVSISTLEHVGYDEEPRDAGKAARAIENLRGLLSPGGELLATIPVGYNRELDDALRDGSLGARVSYLARVGELRWKQVGARRHARAPRVAVAGTDAVYGWPWPGANVLAVARWRSRPSNASRNVDCPTCRTRSG